MECLRVFVVIPWEIFLLKKCEIPGQIPTLIRAYCPDLNMFENCISKRSLISILHDHKLHCRSRILEMNLISLKIN